MRRTTALLAVLLCLAGQYADAQRPEGAEQAVQHENHPVGQEYDPQFLHSQHRQGAEGTGSTTGSHDSVHQHQKEWDQGAANSDLPNASATSNAEALGLDPQQRGQQPQHGAEATATDTQGTQDGAGESFTFSSMSLKLNTVYGAVLDDADLRAAYGILSQVQEGDIAADLRPELEAADADATQINYDADLLADAEAETDAHALAEAQRLEAQALSEEEQATMMTEEEARARADHEAYQAMLQQQQHGQYLQSGLPGNPGAGDTRQGAGDSAAEGAGSVVDLGTPAAEAQGVQQVASAGGGGAGADAGLGGEGSGAALVAASTPPPPPQDDQVQVAAPDPLGGLTVEQVQQKLKAAKALLYADPSGRDVAAGLQRLRELHALVEAALPSTPLARARYAPPAPATAVGGASAGSDTSDSPGTQAAASGEGEGAVAAAQTEAPPASAPKQRPLAVEVAENRHSGLRAAASATFQLAALAASGVLPPAALPADPVGAVLALHQAARGGSLEALMALADRHAQGIGGPASCTRGLQFAKLAATYLIAEVEKEQRYAQPLPPVSLRERHSDSGYVAAEDAENGADVISLEEDMALRGNPDAVRRMAYRRLVGRGLEADPEGAFHDFQAAAQQGDPYAIFNVGYMYLRGLYVPQNYTAAKEYFQRAAEKGLPAAHNGLGVLAWNGQGMPANLTAARESFERGAAVNNSDSLYNLATMHYHGAGTAVNQTLAAELFQRAADAGHWRAPYMLALAHEAGAGVAANCSRALELLRGFFADRSTWGEQLTAAVKLLDAGDPTGALLTYVTVAEQGSAAAAANAAWLLRRLAGYRGPDADRLAAKYFQRAAKQGHTGSMVELAHMILAAAPQSPPQQQRPAPAPAPSDRTPSTTPAAAAAAPGHPDSNSPSPSTTAAASEASPTTGAPAGQDLNPGAQSSTLTPEAAGSHAAEPGDPASTAVSTTATTTSSTSSASSSADTTSTTSAAAPSGTTDGTDGAAESGSDATTAPSASAATLPNGTSAVPIPASGKRGGGGLALQRDPSGPPLVPPSPLPSGRAILGLSTAEDAVAWCRAAAAAGDPEGLFYLGWAHYRGVGAEENATLARLLWLRSFEVAGVRSPRALAPLLALAGVRLDAWLAPLLGPHALARAHAALVWRHDQVLTWLGRAGAGRQGQGAGGGSSVSGGRTGSGAAAAAQGWSVLLSSGGGNAGGAGMRREDLMGEVGRVLEGLGRFVGIVGGGDGGSQDAGENAVMVGLLAALVVVLVVRRRRMAGQT